MYNNVGLQTARGSGGSGYVQKNLSVTNNNFKKANNKQEFLKELDQMRKNNLPPARKANPEIIQHQRKREILIHTLKLREKLKAEGLSPGEIEQMVKKAQTILKDKMQKGQMQTRAKQTHVLTQAKQKQYMSLSKAFGLQANHKIGSSFDFQGIKNQKLKRIEDKKIKDQQRFKCPHQQCGKFYDIKQLLDRHLKYKHPQTYKVVEEERQKQRKQWNEKRRAIMSQQQRQNRGKKRQSNRIQKKQESRGQRNRAEKYQRRSRSRQRKRSYSRQKQSGERKKVVQRKASEDRGQTNIEKKNTSIQPHKVVEKKSKQVKEKSQQGENGSEKSNHKKQRYRLSSSSSSWSSSSSSSYSRSS